MGETQLPVSFPPMITFMVLYIDDVHPLSN